MVRFPCDIRAVPIENQHLVRMLASRIEEDTSLIAELAGLVEAEVGSDETYRCLLTVPGVGPRTAAQLVLSVDICV